MAETMFPLRVLIVEDEYYLAADLAEALQARGARIVGPVGTFDEALAAVAADEIDMALLDMNLRGEMSFAVAERLAEAGIPFVIATGYSTESLPESLRDRPRVEKPFRPEQVADMILAAAPATTGP